MIARFSASKLPLLAKCQWWARTDAAHTLDDEPSVSALLGTATHAVAEGEDVESVIAAAVDVDADDLKALVASYEEWWPTYSAGREWRKEVPLALDLLTGRARELTGGGQGHYADVSPYEVPGTADAIAVDGSEVVDLKTGQAPKTTREYREQVEHAAAAVAAMTGAAAVKATIAHVTVEGVFVTSLELDALDIAEAVDRVRTTLGAIETAEPQPGPHCRAKFCPALATCPVVARPLAAHPDVRHLPLVGDLESDSDAELLHDALPRFEAWVKDRKAAIKRRALARGEVTFSDGRRLVVKKARRETLRLDVDGAVDALRSVLGDAADDAITMKTSKEAVKRAARVGGLPMARVEREVVDALRRVGAVKASEYDEIEVQPPALPATGTENGR